MHRCLAPMTAIVMALLIAACTSDEPGSAPADAPRTVPAPSERALPELNPATWRVHPIDTRFKGANALGPGDVNGDGFADYVTNYEFDQRYVIALHPGTDGDVTGPWPTIDVFEPECEQPECGINPEFAVLADLDGDDALDVVAAQGWSQFEAWEGSEAGIRVIWGPGPERAADADAWDDAGRFPITEEAGHFHFLRTADVNGDGALDIVAGGRVHGGNGSRAGLLWLEAPVDPEQRRDLSAWERHDIAPDQTGGRNFVFADLDDDGDDDIVVANADFDTEAADEGVFWYEHPGADDDALRQPWVEHEIYRGDEFHIKPQIAVEDLDGDGLDDLITQIDTDVYWFRKTSADPVEFELTKIPKDPIAQQLSRPIRVADIDGDGKLDLVGGLVHEDGTLRGDKASLYWMSLDGDDPATDPWTTHAITWGAGTSGVILAEFAEKWDLIELVDIDGDGDLDLVANNEEWWEDAGQPGTFWGGHPPAVQAVVWYENRLREPPEPVAEDDGVVTIDAAAFADEMGGTWTSRTVVPGYEGDGYAQATSVVDVPAPAAPDRDLGRQYPIELLGGAYDVWVRISVPDAWGAGLGGDRSDSAWLSIDGASDDPWLLGDDGETGEGWRWIRVADGVDLAAGARSVGLHPREGGMRIDQVVVARSDAGFDPT